MNCPSPGTRYAVRVQWYAMELCVYECASVYGAWNIYWWKRWRWRKTQRYDFRAYIVRMSILILCMQTIQSYSGFSHRTNSSSLSCLAPYEKNYINNFNDFSSTHLFFLYKYCPENPKNTTLTWCYQLENIDRLKLNTTFVTQMKIEFNLLFHSTFQIN